eukprot:COSAG02_NODE_932_length_15816_cov_15.913088_8_plen_210_part_00
MCVRSVRQRRNIPFFLALILVYTVIVTDQTESNLIERTRSSSWDHYRKLGPETETSSKRWMKEHSRQIVQRPLSEDQAAREQQRWMDTHSRTPYLPRLLADTLIDSIFDPRYSTSIGIETSQRQPADGTNVHTVIAPSWSQSLEMHWKRAGKLDALRDALLRCFLRVRPHLGQIYFPSAKRAWILGCPKCGRPFKKYRKHDHHHTTFAS